MKYFDFLVFKNFTAKQLLKTIFLKRMKIVFNTKVRKFRKLKTQV
jgi:hypothetical protein